MAQSRTIRLLLGAALVLGQAGCGGGGTAPVAPPTTPASTGPTSAQLAAFEADLEQRTFQYFWDTSNGATCLVPDRYPTVTFSSIAAAGFALTAYGIGAERGYVARADAAARTLTCLQFFAQAPQGSGASGVTGYQGFFYHFLNFADGTRYQQVELSTVDTSLLLAGVLFAQSYYTGNNATETQIRQLAETIYERVNWQWAQRNRTGTQAANLANSHGIVMGWTPEGGYLANDWIGYNEGMLIYVLAAGSPTYPVGQDAWTQGWAATLASQWGTYQGQSFLQFGPLFGHQYSHVWIDFNGISEPFIASHGTDYFQEARAATYAQAAYGAANPNGWTGYSANVWGWTASDGPIAASGTYAVGGVARTFYTYQARGVSAAGVVDDGTIAPTAAGGSIAFAPEIALPALYAMNQTYGARIYGQYGFADAFNPSFTFTTAPVAGGTVDAQSGWVDGDWLGIDQGPIVAMIENHRSQLVWTVMRSNPHVSAGLKALGFTGGWLN